jgi:hypothetical protein
MIAHILDTARLLRLKSMQDMSKQRSREANNEASKQKEQASK